MLTTDDMLLKAENKYTELKTDSRWKATSIDPNESVFACFNCGDNNCNSDNCPKPKNDALIAKRKARYDQYQKQNGGRGGGRGGRGKGKKGKGGRNRSNSQGRGGGRGNGNGGSKWIEKDKTPPTSGESHEKVVNGTTLKWCGKCKYWTWGRIAHLTKDHRDRDSANTANDDDTNTTATETSTDTSATGGGNGGNAGKTGKKVGFSGYASIVGNFR